jgi:hypothetical protein
LEISVSKEEKRSQIIIKKPRSCIEAVKAQGIRAAINS